MVDGLERQWRDLLKVAHLDIADASAGPLLNRYDVRVVPTFLLLDGQGEVVWRQNGGIPDADEIETELARLLASP